MWLHRTLTFPGKPAQREQGMRDDVEAFLGAAAVSGSQVKRIDTHAATVFLSGDRALKIKRAIKLPFLDFSTPARRKAACEAELAANRPFAPAIYRRVVPITREHDGTLAIGGAGEPVEWALEMARFDEDTTLDKLAARGEITPGLASAIADAIAAAHAGAPVVKTSGWPESIGAIISQNADAFRADPAFPAAERDELNNLSRKLAARLMPLVKRRNDDGFVRRCHGDLHLANLVVIDGRPVLFDALEFDERLATTDVMHDLAFTLMDLLHFGCDNAANILLNRYIAATPHNNLEAVALLPLSISMRAAVRANVLMCRAAQVESRDRLADTARAYFTLARSALDSPPPCLIAIGGLSGTGKSAVARALAPSLGAFPGAVVLRSDTLRKRMLGVAEFAKLPSSAYREAFNAEVYVELERQAAIILKQGHSVIVDAVFAREGERSAIESVATQAATPFVGFFLVADLATRLQRVGQRRGDASDATVEVAEAQEARDIGVLTWMRIDAGGTRDATRDRCRTFLPASCLRQTRDRQ
jgi:aminoglycoside phosphotransferase family enzyme/predicted kinase